MCGFRVFIIFYHDTGSFDDQLTGLSLGNRIQPVVYNLDFPVKAGQPYGADLVHVFHSQMDASRAGAFGQTIVGIVLMMGKDSFPFLN